MPFFIRQAGRHVSGPFDTAAVRDWIREGRVTDEMELSEDRTVWHPSGAVPRLTGPAKRRTRRRRRRL